VQVLVTIVHTVTKMCMFGTTPQHTQLPIPCSTHPPTKHYNTDAHLHPKVENDRKDAWNYCHLYALTHNSPPTPRRTHTPTIPPTATHPTYSEPAPTTTLAYLSPRAEGGGRGAAAENPWLLSWVREYDKGQTTIIKNWRIPRPLARKLDRFSCCACSSAPGVALVGRNYSKATIFVNLLVPPKRTCISEWVPRVSPLAATGILRRPRTPASVADTF
jgi:hypothetical protein